LYLLKLLSQSTELTAETKQMVKNFDTFGWSEEKLSLANKEERELDILSTPA
jgi:hypothetical protein